MPPMNGGIALRINLENSLVTPSRMTISAPGMRLPIMVGMPMVAPIMHSAPSGTYEGPCAMGYFMNMPLCRSVAMPHAKKLICRKNDRFPPCNPMAPPRMSGMMYRSIDRMCCNPRTMDLPTGILSSIPATSCGLLLCS